MYKNSFCSEIELSKLNIWFYKLKLKIKKKYDKNSFLINIHTINIRKNIIVFYKKTFLDKIVLFFVTMILYTALIYLML